MIREKPKTLPPTNMHTHCLWNLNELPAAPLDVVPLSSPSNTSSHKYKWLSDFFAICRKKIWFCKIKSVWVHCGTLKVLFHILWFFSFFVLLPDFSLHDTLKNGCWERCTLRKSCLFIDKFHFPLGSSTFDSGVDFIRQKYLEKNQNEKKEIYAHLTCATDTENIDFVFKAVSTMIIKRRLELSGLIT